MATRFITNDIVLDVRFVEDDRLVWYKGVVMRVDNRYDGGCKCFIQFEDGDCIHLRLWDKEYNDTSSLYTWRFVEDGLDEVSDIAGLAALATPAPEQNKRDALCLALWLLVMLPVAVASSVFFVWLSYGLVTLKPSLS